MPQRYLIRDKYFFVDSPQKVFPFATYFVTKFDDNYNEDYNLSVHNSLSTGGHFKSPSCSPTHTSRANSTVGTPLGETPNVSPYVSPRGSPTRKQSIFDIFDKSLHKSKQNSIKRCKIPDVRVNQATPENSLENDSQVSEHQPSDQNKKKGRRLLSFVSDLRRSTDSVHSIDNSSDQINEQIITEKVGQSLEPNKSTTKTKTLKEKKRNKKRFFILFCFRSKREQNNSVNQIKLKSETELSQQNVIPNEKCIKSNVNNRTEDDIIGKHLDSCDDPSVSAYTSHSPTKDVEDIVNYKEKRRKKHRICGCFSK